MSQQRTAEDIKNEIVATVGYFPPLYGPAMATPAIMESIWSDTKVVYLNSPIPALFRGKLTVSLARFSDSPYILVSTSATLASLGVPGAELLSLLERPPLSVEKIETVLQSLKGVKLDAWPKDDSELERKILDCAIAIYLNLASKEAHSVLRELLPPNLCSYLVQLISYCRMVIGWVESQPTLDPLSNPVVRDHLPQLFETEPKLEAYITQYHHKVFQHTDRVLTASAEIERQRLLSLFEQAPIPLAMLTGPEHRFTYVNPAYANSFLGGRDIVGRTVKQALPEVIEQGFHDLLDKVYRTGETFVGRETPIELSAGGEELKSFHLDFIYQPTRNSAGEIIGILVVATDVSEQVRAREYLSDQFAWLTSILNKIPSPLMLLDPKTNEITFGNDATRKYFSLDVTNTTPNQRYNGSIRTWDSSGRLLDIDEIPSARVARGETLKDFEFTLESGAGRFEMAASSDIIPASYGHEERALLMIQDLTPIRAAETQFRLFTELAPQMPFIADASGAITYFSKQWYEYVGNIGGTEGWDWKDTAVHHPDDLQLAVDTWTESVKTGKPYQIEYRLRRHDGEYRWHLGRAVATRNEAGEILRWFGTNVDIHDQKLLLAELQTAKNAAETASETKSSFLANMSHEIRTPLGAILGFTDILLDSNPESEERQQYLEIISRNGKALTRVIDDILDLSKVEAGRLEIQKSEFSLSKLLQDVRDLFSATARAKNIDLQFSTSTGRDLFISDPVRLRQILINIVGNAVKFTEQGSIFVATQIRVLSLSKFEIEFAVTDTGPGLSEDDQKKLFQAFSQADNSSTRKFGGTGLGLALSRKLASVLGGDVFIRESKVAFGTTFVVTIIADGPERVKLPREVSAKNDSKKVGQLAGIKVLLVEDSPDNQQLINIILSRQGATLDFANDGKEGIKKALAGDHDVVLLDIQMPLMDGYETIAALKTENYKRPIFALTAHALSEERKKTEAAGFSGHLTKPINSTELIEVIARFKRE